MVRRVSVPGADELFRPTAEESARAEATAEATAAPEVPAAPARTARTRRPRSQTREPAPRQPSGRVRHDEKMTVYVTSEELLEIESARLQLRSRHGLAVDRGRLVREAIALALHDLETAGEESQIVRRLSE